MRPCERHGDYNRSHKWRLVQLADCEARSKAGRMFFASQQNWFMRTVLVILAALALALCFSGSLSAQDRDSSGVPKTSASAPPPAERVDINHASVEGLLKVPGMTESWAGRIVRFRPYRTKQDLLEKGVVNSQVYDRIKDYVIAHREKQ